MKANLPDDIVAVTYIGHATALIQMGKVTILTDPNFSDRLAWVFKRHSAPGIPFNRLPDIDVLVISHEHLDHMNKPTLRRLDKSIPVIVSQGIGREVEELGFSDVRELSWWENTVVRGVVITAVPAQHDATNSGYIIGGPKTIYFAGDTGLFPGFKEIGRRFQIDIALLPIGGYEPHFPMNKIAAVRRILRRDHLAPEDIPEALKMLGNPLLIPIHWGTFKLTGEPLDEPRRKLLEIIKESSGKLRNRLLQPGEVFIIDTSEEKGNEK